MTGAPDLADLGLAAVASAAFDAAHARRMARTLDLDDAVLDEGTLPLTWIWAYFTPMAPTGALRSDGHPATADGGPLAGLDRRMFIGGSLERRGAVRLDEPTRRESAILGAEHKQGGSGAFLLVDVEHRYHQRDEIVVVERQKLMYRAQPSTAVDAPEATVDAPPSAGPQFSVRPDERLLFRYSALTFNTHRIHYDLPYATGVEGYPGLVVHGPLTATLLAHLARQELGSALSSFEFRATTPTFAGTAVHFVCDERAQGEPLSVRAVREDGAEVMTARAG